MSSGLQESALHALEWEGIVINWNTKLGRRAKRRLEHERVIWFTTVSADLTPQPRPVWFYWDGAMVLIYSQPNAHKVHHVRARPAISLHFNTDEAGSEVIVFTGRAELDPAAPPAHKVRGYIDKYRKGIADLEMTPEGFSREYSVAIRVTLEKLRGF